MRKEEIEVWVKVRDGLAMAAQAIDDLLNVEKPEFKQAGAPQKIDVTGLTWEEIQTENPFEVNKQDGAEAYKLLKAKIAEKQGKPVFIDGCVYWMMRDGTTLARRKK